MRVAVGRVMRRLRNPSAEGGADGAVKLLELLVLLRPDREGDFAHRNRSARTRFQAIAGVVRTALGNHNQS